ncbi:hypothetical protein [Microbacterium aurantiacum]|nr:hypothetical protein [Microbacterium aurantiacum]
MDPVSAVPRRCSSLYALSMTTHRVLAPPAPAAGETVEAELA